MYVFSALSYKRRVREPWFPTTPIISSSQHSAFSNNVRLLSALERQRQSSDNAAIQRKARKSRRVDSKSGKECSRRQGIFWMLTIPYADFVPYHPGGIQWLKCQLEQGESTGYLHWQIIVATAKKCSKAFLISLFGDRGHYELTRSPAADDYVWKEETRVGAHQYEFGAKPFQRNQRVWTSVF